MIEYLHGVSDVVINEIKKNTKGTTISQYVSKPVVDNIYKQYLYYIRYYGAPEIISRVGVAVKWSPKAYLFSSKLSDVLNLDKMLILNFFLALYDLTKAGKIDFKYYDPKAAAQGTAAYRKINPSLFHSIEQATSGPLNKIVIITVSIAAVVLVLKFKK